MDFYIDVKLLSVHLPFMESLKYKRIAFLGPAPPFRGGISNFGYNLAIALRDVGAEVKLFNFVRQYPALIFPGGSQTELVERNDQPDIEAVYTPYLPWTWGKAVKAIKQYQPDLLIISYWLPFFAPSYAFIASQIKDCRIFFLAHNIESHERWPLGSLFRKLALRKADQIILLSKACQVQLNKLLPNRVALRGVLGFHPIEEKEAVAVKTENKQILFFGLIKAYKGLDLLLMAIPLIIKEIPDIKLVVAGAVYGESESYYKLIDDLGIKRSVELQFRYISDNEMADFFSRSQLCILPYRTATQSGVIANAYSFGVPVLATDVGGLKEYIEPGRTGYLVAPEDSVALAEAVVEHYRSNALESMRISIAEYRKRYSWQKLAEFVQGL